MKEGGGLSQGPSRPGYLWELRNCSMTLMPPSAWHSKNQGSASELCCQATLRRPFLPLFAHNCLSTESKGLSPTPLCLLTFPPLQSLSALLHSNLTKAPGGGPILPLPYHGGQGGSGNGVCLISSPGDRPLGCLLTQQPSAGALRSLFPPSPGAPGKGRESGSVRLTHILRCVQGQNPGFPPGSSPS